MSEVSLPPSDDSDWNREFDPRSDARERALNILFEADLRAVAPSEVVERMQVAIDDLTSILVVGVAEHRAQDLLALFTGCGRAA